VADALFGMNNAHHLRRRGRPSGWSIPAFDASHSRPADAAGKTGQVGFQRSERWTLATLTGRRRAGRSTGIPVSTDACTANDAPRAV
jgi:hypothetical protein